ncbi:hypothetical protein LCGC14_1538270 [marine sediment metagenome]|uniref:Uncharacterized protein n=1 Tax=marine sediment metagenome TaxID=412755 RepID=A0A0F9LUQ0_9ZZZZ
MTFDEAKQCFREEIMHRWSNWQPEEVEIKDWSWALKPFSKACVEFAARQHKIDCDWKNPSISKVIKICKEREPENVKSNKKISRKWPIWIQHAVKGWQRQVCIIGDCDKDMAMRIAHKQREAYERIYGEKFVVIQEG